MRRETPITCQNMVQPESVQDNEGFSPEDIQHKAVNSVVELTKVLGGKGFDNIMQTEVNNIIDADSETRTDKDMPELTKSASKEQEAPDPEEEEGELGLTIRHLSDLLGQQRIARKSRSSVSTYG